MSDPFKAMLDWCERTLVLSSLGKELVMNNEKNLVNAEWLEDEEIYTIVAKILPHLQGLSHTQAGRVLGVAINQTGRIAKLDSKLIQQACEELQRASSGQA